ncbi:MAG: phosphoenolpyruvate--protein phosphotransferase [Zavarzinella sp.]
MTKLRGIPVSPGVAIGHALVLDTDGFRIPVRKIPAHQIDNELARLDAAIQSAAQEAVATQKSLSNQYGASYGAIFGAHAMLFEDPAFVEEIRTIISSNLLAAESAVHQVVRSFVRTLESMNPDDYFAWRSADLFDIEQCILKHLMGGAENPLKNISEEVIIVARELSPSETATLNPHYTKAFATEHGGKASHTAIIANAMEIPAVLGLGPFLREVTSGDPIIVDGTEGIIILKPDTETLKKYEDLRFQRQQDDSKLHSEKDLPSVTLDGVIVSMLGNIEFPNEAASCRNRGAQGIGLYRTEFLYLGHDSDPSEEEHFHAYRQVLQDIGPGQPVIIRTIDLGADKFVKTHAPTEPEKNPSLGMRSIRLCLRDKPLFTKQLRAILRASCFGDIRIMFPMVCNLAEIRHCRFLLNEVMDELRESNIHFNARLPIGMMVEVPSACLMAREFAAHVDFFSIGTNDLIQYTLAADRTNEHVADLYNAADPAVIRLIHMVVQAATEHQVEVSVCGEVSGDPLFTPLLVGLGIKKLSVSPNHIASVKQVVRRLMTTDLKTLCEDVLIASNARDVHNLLVRFRETIFPEEVDGYQV